MDIIWTGNVTFFLVVSVLLLVGWYVDERWLAPRRAHNRAVARRRQMRLTQTRSSNVRIGDSSSREEGSPGDERLDAGVPLAVAGSSTPQGEDVLLPLLVGEVQPESGVPVERDTGLHAIPGPPPTTPGWVRAGWQRTAPVASRRAALRSR